MTDQILKIEGLDHDPLPRTAAQESELESRLASLAQDHQNSVSWVSLKAEL